MQLGREEAERRDQCCKDHVVNTCGASYISCAAERPACPLSSFLPCARGALFQFQNDDTWAQRFTGLLNATQRATNRTGCLIRVS